MSAELIDLVHRLGQPHVVVIGDVMLDRYVWGDAERVSQEAPVILLRADKREERLGGASSVGTMLRALGAKVAVAGVVGNDDAGERLRHLLQQLDMDCDSVHVDPDRPTTVKERYLGRAQHRHQQQILRVDYERREPVPASVEARLRESITCRIRKSDVVLVSDYDKGVCTPGLLAHVISTARSMGRPVLVDPARLKRQSDRHPYQKYRGSSLMTPNRLEAGLALGRTLTTPDHVLDAAAELVQQLDLDAATITLDKDGMALADATGRRELFPTRPRQVYDITGAGDMVLCVLGLALAAGADYATAIGLANVAGGLEVEKVGVAAVTRDEILRDLRSTWEGKDQRSVVPHRKIVDAATLANELETWKAGGKRIAFTNGCFDILHAGHVQYLQEAKAQADLLVVGLNSDASVRALKGSHRPINPAEARADVLAALQCVDYVTTFDELTPLELIRMVRPDVLVKGSDYRKEEVVGADFVESYGGTVYLAEVRAGFSTTAISERMADSEKRRVA